MKYPLLRVIPIILLTAFFLQSCDLFRCAEIIYSATVEFTGGSDDVFVQTDDGTVVITGMDATYAITLQNENGREIDGYIISYREEYGESILRGYDPEGRYESFFLKGDASEIASLLNSDGSSSASMTGDRILPLVPVVVVGVVTVGVLSWNTYGLTKISKEVKEYVYDSIDIVYNGEAVLKTTPREFSDKYLMNWFNAKKSEASILFSCVSLGLGSAAAGIKDAVIEISLALAPELVG
ncbi:MAG: hypothetical protein JW760_14910 [Spirochaetales bacterium]|nr:hypothetical protein [Spirochaetales bacterium]